MCADAAPKPWHPHQYSRRSGTPLEQVNLVLKDLWDFGLLERAAPDPEHGPGVRLSAKGFQVLNDPVALRRLCEGAQGTPDPERSAQLLEQLRTPGFAYVNWSLLGVNILVFLAGLYLAYANNVALSYVGGQKTLIAAAIFIAIYVAFNVRPFAQYTNNSMVRIIVVLGLIYWLRSADLFAPAGAAVDAIRDRCGALTVFDWLNGKWWRILTTCFVHLGLLHLLCNMLMLVGGGWFIERLWGHARFLVIYLLAGIAGSLFGLAFNPGTLTRAGVLPGGVAGASGALCGLVAAEATWVLFNGRHLPQKLQQAWRNNLLLNVSLLVTISLVPGVSYWAHLGGALAGGVTAVCFHFQRVGPPVWRWAALLGLVLVPASGLYLLDRQRRSEETWAAVEVLWLHVQCKNALEFALDERRADFQEKVRPVLNKRPSRREEAEVTGALTVLAGQEQELKALQAKLKSMQPVSKNAQEIWQATVAALAKRLEMYELAERSLHEGEKFPKSDDDDLMNRIAATPDLRKGDENPGLVRQKPAETEEERQAREKREREAKASLEQQREIDREIDAFNEGDIKKIGPPLRLAQRLFDDKLSSDLGRPPDEWIVPTLKKNRAALAESRKQLKALLELVPTLGPYKAKVIVKALDLAKAYAEELEKLLALTDSRYEAGDKWTEDEQAALKAQEKKVVDARRAWQDFLTDPK